ncbi:MAG: hypothetical protein KKD28_04955 [Chloroflexi bacterium]|nr:hypothetical protein [Chloroflexota bacterium]
MKTILLYGTSIFLAGLTELMHTLPDLHIETCQRLADLGDLAAFDAVLVDLNNPKTSDVLNLLRARPDLTVIGINTASGTVTVLSGQVYLAETLEDVVVHLQAADVKKEVLIDDI